MNKSSVVPCFARLSLLTLPAIFLLWLPLLSHVRAAASDLDPTFGTGGKVLIDFNGWYNRVDELAIQPDGKIIVVGPSWSGGSLAAFTLARLHRDGSLDSTFGEGGKVTVNFTGGYDIARDVAVQPDGRIVVVGAGFFVVRYSPQGNLDPTFGNGGSYQPPFMEAITRRRSSFKVMAKSWLPEKQALSNSQVLTLPWLATIRTAVSIPRSVMAEKLRQILVARKTEDIR